MTPEEYEELKTKNAARYRVAYQRMSRYTEIQNRILSSQSHYISQSRESRLKKALQKINEQIEKSFGELEELSDLGQMLTWQSPK